MNWQRGLNWVFFGVRELIGWGLVGLGLFGFLLMLVFLTEATPRVIQSVPLLIFSVFIFRGGIHLIKVAVAARVALLAQERLYPTPPRAKP